MQDRIEKTIDVHAPLSRVWRAITDFHEFGRWFGANLEGPFEVGVFTRGQVTIPGYEHLRFEALTEVMESEHEFAFRWHPAAGDPDDDLADEPRTLVTFRLAATAAGTRIELTESGFSALPIARRDSAFESNNGGWDFQLGNIKTHAES